MPIFSEGPTNILHGISDCASSQSFMSWFWKSCFTDSHGEGSNKEVLLLLGEVDEVMVVFNSNQFCVVLPLSPRPSLLLVCSSFICLLMGNLSSNTVRNVVISLGSWQILKLEGTCEGQEDLMILVSSLLLLLLSHKRASVTLFFFSLKHWL